jgi:hypothetical protein
MYAIIILMYASKATLTRSEESKENVAHDCVVHFDLLLACTSQTTLETHRLIMKKE